MRPRRPGPHRRVQDWRRRARNLLERFPGGKHAVHRLRRIERRIRQPKDARRLARRKRAVEANAKHAPRPARARRRYRASHVFLAPHNDDETLFGAFTLLREDPLVIVCLRSFGQEERGAGVTWQTREAETARALQELGVTAWEQWEMPDSAPDWTEFEARLRELDAKTVYAPAVEEDGHDQHNAVGAAALSVFGDRVVSYLTYTQRGKSTSSNEVPYEGWMIERKLTALACYRSQFHQPAMRSHFLRDLHEYYA